MKRSLLAGAIALQFVPLALAAPLPVPKATPVPRLPFMDENQLLQTGSFELPRVQKRTAFSDLPNYAQSWQGEWMGFFANQAATKSPIKVGLTNEAAHAGKQAVFVDFDHVKTPGAQYSLTSALLPIKGEETYHVNLWGKLDEKRPLVADQRMPLLRLRVDFFQGDGETQIGESKMKVQPLPGDVRPNKPLLFNSLRWTEYFADEKAPPEAVYIKISWSIGTSDEAGTTNGVMYFDDFGISGVKMPYPELTDKVVPPAEPPPETEPEMADGTPAAPGAEGKPPAPVLSNPGTPIVPGNPSVPGTPVTPGVPTRIGIPVTPGAPVKPGASVVPEKPAPAPK